MTVNSSGLAALYGALADYAECVVVAPEQDKKWRQQFADAGPSPHPHTLANGFISINGTPYRLRAPGYSRFARAAAGHGGVGHQPGCQPGVDDVLYSGIVAAAPRPLDRPLFAFSLYSPPGGQPADGGVFARKLLEAHASLNLPPRTVLIVNIPNPLAKIRYPTTVLLIVPVLLHRYGWRSARQGRLLDCCGRRCRRRRPGHGLPCRDAGLCIDHAAATGSHLW